MCGLIGGMAKAIFDDYEDCAVIVIDDEDKVIYNNCFASSLVSTVS
ncbi:MAG: hypothetical protein PHN17_05790 [Syntrophaceticus sp.]|nr:hypothetical protein [Syntrophaceticus sp.]